MNKKITISCSFSSCFDEYFQFSALYFTTRNSYFLLQKKKNQKRKSKNFCFGNLDKKLKDSRKIAFRISKSRKSQVNIEKESR